LTSEQGRAVKREGLGKGGTAHAGSESPAAGEDRSYERKSRGVTSAGEGEQRQSDFVELENEGRGKNGRGRH